MADKYYKTSDGMIIRNQDNKLTYYDRQKNAWRPHASLGEIYTGEMNVKPITKADVDKVVKSKTKKKG